MGETGDSVATMRTGNEHKRRLLFVGDGCVSTGFAKATRAYLDVLSDTWDVSLLALNYKGDTRVAQEFSRGKYDVYSCFTFGRGDGAGYQRLPELVNQLMPDVVVVQNDPWNMPAYIRAAGNVPVIGVVAVDGLNCRGADLNGLRLAIFWTKFAQDEAAKGGYRGASTVVPLGVDLDVFKPMPRDEARRRVGWPDRLRDGFIVGVYGRNHTRKRFDLAVMYFAEWVKTRDVRDAYLAVHAAPTGDTGYDVPGLMQYFGLSNRLFMPPVEIGRGMPEDKLATIYGMIDVQASFANEGWGLHQMEGMACGRALEAPDWAALSEWPKGAASLIECTSFSCPHYWAPIAGVPDRQKFIEQLDLLYQDRASLDLLAEAGRQRVSEPQYRWRAIGERVRDVIEQALHPERSTATRQPEMVI